ncbi:hypothetical protein CAOG_00747 [Capsaspora owczarzaki ATCC 30864]|uniref:PRELI/MSF1 domain-containing protein n=1 Tax=Capsaspora owczarzaki (strain ATCC 30864) TaxID=595528 RepID=A0A0D2X0K8_CAPO3|nr:hypothetical protein CAOG_00747 [Capsaspora owczarzaki ATCC 30864]KJE89234.1 hypothetical protein CAOG_000747 [Capsaspora owczarzaki ATCC 30864]|eukprot:XP_004365618.1 hypothetical protein CAOG_00747 [Capsaspora owczarzaki ATCC 30864]
MKLFEATHIFGHSWDKLTLASFRKYPNPFSPHVVSVDVVNRYVDPASGKLITHRLVTMESGLPGWLSRVMGFTAAHCHVHETSEVDPTTQTMTLRTKNLSWSDLFTVEEMCQYAQDRNDASRTVFTQEARIHAFGSLATLRSRIEGAMLDRFRSTAAKGKEAIEFVCESLSLEQQEATISSA